ncbi:ester cyclase [Halobacteriaceae archaeon GCM10025711]
MATKSIADRHKENFRRLMAETHEGNLAIIDDLVADDVVTHGFFGMDATDREEYKQFFANFGAAFGDQAFVVEDLVAEDDLLVVHFSISAVHQGAILGIEPSGKELVDGNRHRPLRGRPYRRGVALPGLPDHPRPARRAPGRRRRLNRNAGPGVFSGRSGGAVARHPSNAEHRTPHRGAEQ